SHRGRHCQLCRRAARTMACHRGCQRDRRHDHAGRHHARLSLGHATLWRKNPVIHSIVQQTTAFITGLPWLALTLIAYGIALYMYRRSRGSAFFLPVFWGVLLVLGVLHLTGAGFAAYAQGNRVLEWLIGPATVALAIPLYGQLHRLKR